ncbi:hypothetical protein Zmor_012332 [Zophobas morio]|uniref:Zinc finger PHD-type domain-containing protein n=1 Tax=Zophobas morio TaxID=2755281 RepID=A0AA38HFX5_9CUCU|nr:hypothetical protein Zmor_012332 [Zophobas morio]
MFSLSKRIQQDPKEFKPEFLTVAYAALQEALSTTLIDKHIRRLDSDLKKFEVELNKSSPDKLSPGYLDSLYRMLLTTRIEFDLEMPVDPFEPTYCICHQVSYGEMIACDNFDCPTGWFHFSCVGLQSKPKGRKACSQKALFCNTLLSLNSQGKWLCMRCQEIRDTTSTNKNAGKDPKRFVVKKKSKRFKK